MITTFKEILNSNKIRAVVWTKYGPQDAFIIKEE